MIPGSSCPHCVLGPDTEDILALTGLLTACEEAQRVCGRAAGLCVTGWTWLLSGGDWESIKFIYHFYNNLITLKVVRPENKNESRSKSLWSLRVLTYFYHSAPYTDIFKSLKCIII